MTRQRYFPSQGIYPVVLKPESFMLLYSEALHFNGGLIMKKGQQSYFLFIVVFVLACAAVSCEKKSAGTFRHIEVYGKETVNSRTAAELFVEIENGKIEVYTHDSNDIIFETAIKASGTGDEDSIRKNILAAGYSIKSDNAKIVFKYPGNKKSKDLYNVSTNVIVYIPVRTKNINIRVEKGNIIFHDNVKCDIDINVITAGVNISRLIGRLRIGGKVGNVRISSGKLKDGSHISMETGNLHIAAEEYQPGTYTFETEKGNITVIIPAKSEVTFENLGIVRENYSSASEHAVKISLRSDIGEISIKNTGY
jgi:hypothetical protein